MQKLFSEKEDDYIKEQMGLLESICEGTNIRDSLVPALRSFPLMHLHWMPVERLWQPSSVMSHGTIPTVLP